MLTMISELVARRKQGGSQGANDNANGKAKSAGAQIRRHNEAALTDVRFPLSYLPLSLLSVVLIQFVERCM